MRWAARVFTRSSFRPMTVRCHPHHACRFPLQLKECHPPCGGVAIGGRIGVVPLVAVFVPYGLCSLHIPRSHRGLYSAHSHAYKLGALTKAHIALCCLHVEGIRRRGCALFGKLQRDIFAQPLIW